MRESYAPVLLKRKVLRLRKETGNPALRSKLDNGLTYSELLKRALIRPTKMLFYSPVVFLLSLYMAVAYGILYVLFTTFTFVFEEVYHFSPGNVGLTYIPIGIGMILGLAVLGFMSDRFIKRVIASGEQLIPEHRLPTILTVPGGVCIPIGMFIYGWTAQYNVHWAVPLFGTIFVGAGLISCMVRLSPIITLITPYFPVRIFPLPSTRPTKVYRCPSTPTWSTRSRCTLHPLWPQIPCCDLSPVLCSRWEDCRCTTGSDKAGEIVCSDSLR